MPGKQSLRHISVQNSLFRCAWQNLGHIYVQNSLFRCAWQGLGHIYVQNLLFRCAWQGLRHIYVQNLLFRCAWQRLGHISVQTFVVSLCLPRFRNAWALACEQKTHGTSQEAWPTRVFFADAGKARSDVGSYSAWPTSEPMYKGALEVSKVTAARAQAGPLENGLSLQRRAKFL